jgi:hypothetical protein
MAYTTNAKRHTPQVATTAATSGSVTNPIAKARYNCLVAAAMAAVVYLAMTRAGRYVKRCQSSMINSGHLGTGLDQQSDAMHRSRHSCHMKRRAAILFGADVGLTAGFQKCLQEIGSIQLRRNMQCSVALAVCAYSIAHVSTVDGGDDKHNTNYIPILGIKCNINSGLTARVDLRVLD